MPICSGRCCFESVPRRGHYCRQCKIAGRVPVCAVVTCPSSPASRGLCLRHFHEARARGTLPPDKNKTRRLRIVAARAPPVEVATYDDADREGCTRPPDKELRRGRTRRSIEDMEATLRARREDAMLAEGDW